jgi:hypothetical protein
MECVGESDFATGWLRSSGDHVGGLARKKEDILVQALTKAPKLWTVSHPSRIWTGTIKRKREITMESLIRYRELRSTEQNR